MNLPSILLLIAVIAAVIASLRFLLRQRKRGCSSCTGCHCATCAQKNH